VAAVLDACAGIDVRCATNWFVAVDVSEVEGVRLLRTTRLACLAGFVLFTAW
jgi:hypothetical protein